MDYALEIENVNKKYGHHPAVENISFKVEEGELACLLGPSGCGKTTLLRAIAGFENINSGKIKIHGSLASSAGYSLPTEKRRIGMLFQDLALFPHLSVVKNAGFGLQDLAKKEKQERVDEMLNLVGLKDYAHKSPHQLSGGQKQRLALARALAPRPRILLLDEPFSSLDVNFREQLSMEVRNIIKLQNITTLMVTHNQNEAFAMADKIGVMDKGKLLQWDTAYNIYHRPVEKSVASFVGEGAMLPGKIVSSECIESGLGKLTGGSFFGVPKDSEVDILIRPEDLVLDDHSPLKAVVVGKTFRGPNNLYALKLDCGDTVQVLLPSHHSFEIGERIGIKAEIKDMVIFDKNNGANGILSGNIF